MSITVIQTWTQLPVKQIFLIRSSMLLPGDCFCVNLLNPRVDAVYVSLCVYANILVLCLGVYLMFKNWIY